MEKAGLNQSVGCAAVLPAAVIGFLGLTDGIGPQGWRGFAELFGWLVFCLAASKCLAVLLMRVGRTGNLAYTFALTAVAGMGALFYKLLDWLCLDAPFLAKTVFTSSMQGLGAVGAALLVLFIAYTKWRDTQR